MLLALGIGAVGDDLAVVVDRGGVVEREPGVGGDEIVEVLEAGRTFGSQLIRRAPGSC